MTATVTARTTGRIRWSIGTRRTARTTATHRVALGPVEVAVGGGWLDLCLPGKGGTILTGILKRDPASAVAIAKRKVADHKAGGSPPPSHVVINTRPLFVGVLGSNIAEIGVGRRFLLITWVENDLRRLARGAPTGDVHPDTGEPVRRP